MTAKYTLVAFISQLSRMTPNFLFIKRFPTQLLTNWKVLKKSVMPNFCNLGKQYFLQFKKNGITEFSFNSLFISSQVRELFMGKKLGVALLNSEINAIKVYMAAFFSPHCCDRNDSSTSPFNCFPVLSTPSNTLKAISASYFVVLVYNFAFQTKRL